MSLGNLLQAIAERENADETTIDISEQVARLPELMALKAVKHDFQPGDLIKWKPNMQVSKLPTENGVAIFVRWLDEPVVENEAGYPLRNNDFVMGVMDKDGDYIEFINDSSRFEPYES